jgi:hypothetical protein
MNLELKNATEHLYDIFSKYHVEGNLRGRSCDCCVTDKEIQQLLSKPLKKLNKDELYHFMTSAITTFGDINDYKHFLPRILELMINNESVIDDFLTFEKLNYSEWETWEVNEITAIDDYFLSLWKAAITNEDASFNTIQGIFEIIEKYVGLNKALEIWCKNASNQSLLFFVDAIWNVNYSTNNDLLFQWFTKSTIKQKIEDLYFETKDEILATKISVVYTMLDSYENN